jgi:hypothetical protein
MSANLLSTLPGKRIDKTGKIKINPRLYTRGQRRPEPAASVRGARYGRGKRKNSLLARTAYEHFTLALVPALQADPGRSRFAHSAVSLSSSTCFFLFLVPLHLLRWRSMRTSARRGGELDGHVFRCSGAQSNHVNVIVNQLQAKGPCRTPAASGTATRHAPRRREAKSRR